MRSDDLLETATPEPTFRKSDWPFYWITRASARYMQVMEKALKPVGIGHPEWRVLMSLYEGESLSVSEISEFCIIKLNTTTKIIQRMTADGLVTCRPRKTDGRVTEVRITEKGNVMRRRARAAADRIFARAFATLDADDVATMNRLLEKVFDDLTDV